MVDISHHYMIYNMKSWLVFGAYGKISVIGENCFENLKICIICTLNAEKQQKSRKNTLFSHFFCRNILLVLKKAITLHSLFRGNTPTRKARSLKCCSFLTSSTREQDGTSVPSVPERQVQHKGENESSAGPGREINLGV